MATAVRSTPAAPSAAAAVGNWGVEILNIDTSIDPGDDFYRFVNNGWLETSELPSGFSRLSSFTLVSLDTEEQVEAIIDDILANDWPDGTTEHNVKAFYQSYMDIERRDELGAQPVQAELDAILASSSHEDIARLMAVDL